MAKCAWALTAGLAALVIVASATVAMRGARSAGSVPSEVSLREADGPATADPAAEGVVAGRSQGSVYLFRPDGRIVGRADDPIASTSVSGRWQAGRNCPEKQPCQLLLFDTTANAPALTPVAIGEGFRDGTWSRAADRLFAVADDGTGWVVEPEPARADMLARNVVGWEWLADGALVLGTWDGEAASLVWLGAGGNTRVTPLSSPVTTFVPSRAGDRLAFAEDGPGGWQMDIVDAAGALRTAAVLGGVQTSPPLTRAPQLAISWSPDGTTLGVSPVAAPFVMYLVPADGGGAVRWFPLREGYAGEMKWSPDGKRLAISTYSLDRKEHRVYLLDSMASDSLRRLVDGCLIFWSPDGRFLVAKPEPHNDDMMAVRVSDGVHWPINGSPSMPKLIPAAWGADEADAMRLARQPARGVGGLGK